MSILASGATIGIIGGGQLGKMSAIAAAYMGYKTHIYSPVKECPAAQVASALTEGAFDDTAALEKFAKAVDVITFEFENIPAEHLIELEAHAPIHPSPQILDICRNRIREKDFLFELGIPVAPYAALHSAADVTDAIDAIGVPCVIKTTEEGYDGKGQVKITDAGQAEEAWSELNMKEAVCEGWIAFEKEISVIVARNTAGEMRTYEAPHNIHQNHILHKTVHPSGISGEVVAKANEIATTIVEALELVGVLAVEMFVSEGGELLVNELAPRPHNSGHWTIEAARTSQFENHIRAIAGHRLGDTSRLCDVEMINLIGEDVNDLPAYMSDPKAHLHLYGKTEVRAGRKMGHVTILR